MDATETISLRLTENPDVPRPEIDAPLRVPAERLTEVETEELLRLLPARSESPETPGFRFPERAAPPPPTGGFTEVIFEDFDGAGPERPQVGIGEPRETGDFEPLKILRFGPEGEVNLAPNLGITFSQPMIPVGTATGAVVTDPPVELSPQLPGHWRWLDTRTLQFEPEHRFPMATVYTVRVPAGTASQWGGRLENELTWTFSTPAPLISETSSTNRTMPARPVIAVRFNQRVDPATALRFASATIGETPLQIIPADETDLASDEPARQLFENTPPGYAVAFRIVTADSRPIPAGSKVDLVFAPGIPSLEGPRASDKIQKRPFKVCEPFRARKLEVEDDFNPVGEITVNFNNSLDERAFSASQISIEPDGNKLSIEVSGNSIGFWGILQPQTTYRVTISPDLKDEFGQALGRETVLSVKTGNGLPCFELADQLAFHPVSHPFVTVRSLNHETFKVSIRAVEPEDWPAYAKAKFGRPFGEKSLSGFPGKVVFSGDVSVEKQPSGSDLTRIDLAPYVAANHVHFIVTVESLLPRRKNDYRDERHVSDWISYNELGIEAVADHQQMDVRVTTRDGFEPMPGVLLTLLPQNISATTDETGHAVFAVSPCPNQSYSCLVASHEGKTSFLTPTIKLIDEYSGIRFNWNQAAPTSKNVAFTFTDRGLYRPGEQVRFKGWWRTVEFSPTGDVGQTNTADRKIIYFVLDSTGNRISRGLCEVDENGGFDGAFTLPKTCETGTATLHCRPNGENESKKFDPLDFEIAEFRRPEFETRLLPSDSGPYFVGDAISFTAEATYYAGGSLPGTAIKWNIEATRADYIPPNRDDFHFGEWNPWWINWFRNPDRWQYDETGDRKKIEGITNGDGRHGVTLETGTTLTQGAIRLTVEATVQDVNRQAMSGRGSYLFHPATCYVGIRCTAQFVGSGKPLLIETIVTDPDGNAVAGRPVTIRLARVEESFEDGESVEHFLDPVEQTLVSTEEPVVATLRPTRAGRYRVTAIVTDARGRASASETRLWVAGETAVEAENGEYLQRNVELIPARLEYAPGETAEILVRSPFQTSEGMLAITRSGIIRTERFSMTGTSHVLKIPIEENWTPNVHLEVSLVGPVPETVRQRFPNKTIPPTASAYDTLELKVAPIRRALAVAAIPSVSELEPGGETVVTVTVKNADGQPVTDAVVAVIVADEAILNLADYRIGKPIETFYPSRNANVLVSHNRLHLNDLLRLWELEEQGPRELSRRGRGLRYGMAAAALGGIARENDHSQTVAFRTDFNPLAFFAPSVKTDAEGRATVTVKLPDNLTRYRVTAVAVSGATHFGVGESLITARLPLMLRPSPPRFLNHGDRCELPLVLQNLTNEELAVSVAARAANAGLPDGAGQRISVPAKDRVEVRFDVTTERPGTAHFDFIAAAPETHPDATSVAFPVYTPTLAESFAVYGVVDDGATGQIVRRPDDALEGFGAIEITTAATQMQSLTDAVVYLQRYPFDCTEQIASRILGAVTVRNFLETFNIPDIPSLEELTRATRRDLATLAQYQQSDGGFGFWNRDSRPFPFLAAYVGLVLTVTAEQDIPVPESMRKRVLGYLKEVEKFIPKDYSEESRRAIAAFALAVRARNGDCDRAAIRNLLLKSQGALPIEALGWLLRAVGADPELASERTLLLRRLTNQVTESAGKAHFVAQYVDHTDVMLATSRRADGIILDALIVADPNNDLIPKLARGLLDARRRGRWHTTQENGFALTALENYFRTYESETPDFIARWWLGERFAGEQAFAGRTTVTAKSDIPLAALTDETVPITLQKEGPGRLYYRIGLTYAPEVPDSKPFSAGFEVERFYESVENPDDVTRDPDGAWRIRAGALVRVKVSMTTRTPRNHVALVDPLPAGLEALNPELAGTQSLPSNNDDEQRNGWWWRRWHSHHNLRDDRAEAFAEWLWSGSYSFTYYARATTPGEFLVPPAKAEEMYHLETFGRTGAVRVFVRS